MSPRSRRRLLGLPAMATAAVAAAALAATPAVAADREFTPSGDEVQAAGSLTDTNAPVLSPGVHSTKITPVENDTSYSSDPQEKLQGAAFYRVQRSQQQSTIYASLTLKGAVGENAKDLKADLMVLLEDGTPCTSMNSSSGGISINSYRSFNGPVATGKVVDGTPSARSTDADAGQGCGQAETLVVAVKASQSDTDGQPIPAELAVMEEPNITNYSQLPATKADALKAPDIPEVSGSPTAVEGGSGFTDATPLEAGTYSDTVSSGQAATYRVWLEPGQRLSVRGFAPGTQGRIAGTGSFEIGAAVFSPGRSAVSSTNDVAEGLPAADSSYVTSGSDPEKVQWAATTPVVAWQNRNITSDMTSDADGLAFSGVGAPRAASVAGWYTVVMGVSSSSGDQLQVPYDFAVTVDGEPANLPTYSDEADDDGSSMGPMPAVVSGLVLLASILGIAWVVVRRSKG